MGQGAAAITAVRAPRAERFQHDHVLSTCGTADILCVQELLSRDAQQFFDRLPSMRFTSRFRDHNRPAFGPPMTMRGSGLGIGARSALSKTMMRRFTSATAGWDRLARKGALYTQLTLGPGVVIDLITVHLQAGPGPRTAAIRAAQLNDLSAFVEAVGSSDRPFIICGDFNIDGLAGARGGAEYQCLRRALKDFEDLGEAADLPTFDPHPLRNSLAHEFEPDGIPRRLDYVFYRPARGPNALRFKAFEIFFDEPLAPVQPNGAPMWASDHYGVSATFEAT
jgi:endonuclease/exonuclease/phosphatase family metal-dependent hydrolase